MSQLGVPVGWRVEENWFWAGADCDVDTAEVWETRQLKRHWWSKRKPVTGWHEAGYANRRYQKVIDWINATIAAQGK